MGKHIQEDNLKTINGESIVGKGNIELPTTDIEEWINSRPKVTKFGERPELLILDDGTAKMVEVSTEGIFTDIRSFSSFVGGAIEGGTNIFKSTIRNVSGVSVGGLEVTVVLPESGDDITYEEPNISNPTTGTVTEVSREGNIYNYDITSLPAGKTIEISFPITWGIPGTFQASTTVKVIDPVVIDYATGDDYSIASYRVSAKSEGEETIDCPLIEVTANGVQVPVYSVSGSIAIGDRIQAVSENEIILETSIPVTFSPAVLGSSNSSLNRRQNEISEIINGYIVKACTSTGVDANPVLRGVSFTSEGSNKLKVVFDDTKLNTSVIIELRAGPECNPQYVYLSNKYKRGEGLELARSAITDVTGISDYIINNEYSTLPSNISFIDLDTGVQYDSVDFYSSTTNVEDSIILNIPSGQERKITITTEDLSRLFSENLFGNITSSYDDTTGTTTLQIADTASSTDSHTYGRVTFNFID